MAADGVVAGDLDASACPAEVEQEMRLVAGGVGDAVEAGPGSSCELYAGLEGIKVDGVVAGAGVLTGFVIERYGTLRRDGPVADDRHEDGRTTTLAAGEADHGGVGVVVGCGNARLVAQRKIRVDGRDVGRTVRKHSAGRGEARVELLAGRRRVADELWIVERSGADKALA